MANFRMESGFLQSLSEHPIFSLPPSGEIAQDQSINPEGLPHVSVSEDSRKNLMCFRGSDLIVAVGKELRITTLVESRTARVPISSYKTLHTPNIEFPIHQVVMCNGGKMLAVAGKYQVAVIMLPRPAYYKLVTAKIDCKSIQVGQYYHAAPGSSPLAKVDWHPWNDGGSSLLVMTSDGILREYDVSRDADEPQQTLSFLPSHHESRVAYSLGSGLHGEVVSFTVGRGKADWGPLTIYALLSSGDVWAMSPFMPSNAVVPSSYVPSLERFVAAKRDILAAQVSTMKYPPAESTSSLEVYDNQLKYVNALLKQLPADVSNPSTSKAVNLRSPTIIRHPPTRQGPFLFQPAPRELAGSEDWGPKACDIIYLGFDDDDEDAAGVTTSENLGVVLISFQDGKVDVCFDVERAEAKWDTHDKIHNSRLSPSDLPLLTVYESIDLGLVSLISTLPLTSQKRMFSTNYTSFHLDSLYSDRVYASHLFGIHILDIKKWLKTIVGALKGDAKVQLESVLEEETATDVTHILNTFSIPHQASVPIVATTIVNTGFINYTLFALTSHFHLVPIELSLRLDDNEDAAPPPRHAPSPARSPVPPTVTLPSTLKSWSDEPYLSILTTSFELPVALSRPASFHISLPSSLPAGGQNVTPDTLRFLGKTVERLRSEIREVTRSANAIQSRITLQDKELSRQLKLLFEMEVAIARIKAYGGEGGKLKGKLGMVIEHHKQLDERLNRCLQILMDNYEPKLSDAEKQWFGELERMRVQVRGEDARSLKDKPQLLAHRLSLLRPGLEALAQKEAAKVARISQRHSLGTTQLKTIETRLTNETKSLEETKKKLEALSEKVTRVNLE